MPATRHRSPQVTAHCRCWGKKDTIYTGTPWNNTLLTKRTGRTRTTPAVSLSPMASISCPQLMQGYGLPVPLCAAGEGLHSSLAHWEQIEQGCWPGPVWHTYAQAERRCTHQACNRERYFQAKTHPAQAMKALSLCKEMFQAQGHS